MGQNFHVGHLTMIKDELGVLYFISFCSYGQLLWQFAYWWAPPPSPVYRWRRGHPTTTIDHMSENQWNKAHLARLWSCLSASHARFDPFWHSWWSASGTWPHPPPLRTAYTLTQRGGGGRHPISTIDHMSKNYWNKAQVAHLWLYMSAPHERFDPIWPWGWSIIDTVAVPCITPI